MDTLFPVIPDTPQTRKTFSPGDTLIKQGDSGDFAYILESGRVEITFLRPDGEKQTIATRGAGTLIGEMALVSEAMRTASVRALTSCQVIKISRAYYEECLKRSDPILNLITKVIVARYETLLSKPGGEEGDRIEQRERAFMTETDILESIHLTNAIEKGLLNDEFFLCFQPIIDLKTGAVSNLESLTRWNHPERGLISPEIFIPVAEKGGLISKIDYWVLEKSCVMLKQLYDGRPGFAAGDFSLKSSINFSGYDLTHSTFVIHFLEILKKTEFPPSCINLEVTERLFIQDQQKVSRSLNQLREQGVTISIDDFGTGYSSLGYLQNLPLDYIKIDRRFIHNMLREKKSLDLVKSIIHLAKSLKLQTVAEGIETRQQLNLLKKLEVDYVQGFYLSPPIPEEELLPFLDRWDTVTRHSI